MRGGGGGLALNFQGGNTRKALLEITDLITSPVCKSPRTN